MSNQLPQGYTLPPVQKPVFTEDIAWLGILSSTVVAAPVFSAAEQVRIKRIRDGQTDTRITAFAQAVLTVNSIAG